MSSLSAFSASLKRRIRSKVESLASILSMFDNPISVLLLYITRRGSIDVSLNKIGIKKNFHADSNNVNKLIRLVKYLRGLSTYLTVRGNVVIIAKNDLKAGFNTDNILDSNTLNYLEVYSKLLPRARVIKGFGENMLYIELEDGLKWVVRKNILSDLTHGVLITEYEWREYHLWFSKLIKKVKTFIDVGAYIGGYSVRACKKGVYVVSVEPDPANFELLTMNIMLNGCKNNAKLLNVAASDRSETLTLYSDRDPKKVNVVGKGKFKAKVKAAPLDIILSALNVKKPVMVKIDVEGFEHKVVKGMKNILQNANYAIIEVHPENNEEVLSFMKSLGFKVKGRFLVSPRTRDFNYIFEMR